MTIVTVTRNSSNELNQFWHQAPTREFEWIVVDNASQDDSLLTAGRLGAKALVRLDDNEGFSKANNRGAALGSTEIIGFVNPDVSITSSGLTEIEAALNDADWLVSPQLRNLDGSLQPNGRGAPSLNHKLMGRLSPRSAEKNGYYRYKQGLEPIKVEWLIGASVFMRRSTFVKLGGWNERFFLYYEDSDLGLRARLESVPSYIVGTENWTHGWQRKTARPNLSAWGHEIKSAFKFYKSFPGLLITTTKA